MSKPLYSIALLLVGAVAGSLMSFIFLGSSEEVVELQNPTVEGNEVEKPQLGGVKQYSNLKRYNQLANDGATETIFDGPILYNTFLVYSQYFADNYGYPQEFVSDELPGFVDLIQYEMKYAGDFQNCHLKILIDKDGPARLPKTDGFVFTGPRIALPTKKPGFAEKAYQKKFRLEDSLFARWRQDYSQNYALMGVGEKENKESRGRLSLGIIASNPFVFPEWDAVSFSAPCTKLIKKIFRRDEAFLAMRSRSDDRSKRIMFETLDEMIVVRFPETLRRQIADAYELIEF